MFPCFRVEITIHPNDIYLNKFWMEYVVYGTYIAKVNRRPYDYIDISFNINYGHIIIMVT